ncbi:hypothetical protein KIN20_036841 [Parelaphostrongylus tenuis]|uniref:NAB co-repressor domain-containing protein n=1 Tax=Parelaphostrongylus tenuis TaxID=148309 RepID=A0AAD5RDT5_PARTN|nr:hypothetical protein KIN20_036841 [Parelaphostrongylus tenuis]
MRSQLTKPPLKLCLIMPSLLTRRDELFPLARQVVKDAGYHYAKASRKRGLDHLDSHSPQSSPTYSPCLGDDNDVDVDSVFGSSTTKQSDEKRKKSDTAQEKGTYLERWASSMLASQQSAFDSPRGTQ